MLGTIILQQDICSTGAFGALKAASKLKNSLRKQVRLVKSYSSDDISVKPFKKDKRGRTDLQ